MMDAGWYTVVVLSVQVAAMTYAWRVAWIEGLRYRKAHASFLRTPGWIFMATAYTGGLALRIASAMGIPRSADWLQAVALVNSCLFLAAAVALSRYYTRAANVNEAATKKMQGQLEAYGLAMVPGAAGASATAAAGGDGGAGGRGGVGQQGGDGGAGQSGLPGQPGGRGGRGGDGGIGTEGQPGEPGQDGEPGAESIDGAGGIGGAGGAGGRGGHGET